MHNGPLYAISIIFDWQKRAAPFMCMRRVYIRHHGRSRYSYSTSTPNKHTMYDLRDWGRLMLCTTYVYFNSIIIYFLFSTDVCASPTKNNTQTRARVRQTDRLSQIDRHRNNVAKISLFCAGSTTKQHWAQKKNQIILGTFGTRCRCGAINFSLLSDSGDTFAC